MDQVFKYKVRAGGRWWKVEADTVLKSEHSMTFSVAGKATAIFSMAEFVAAERII